MILKKNPSYLHDSINESISHKVNPQVSSHID